MNSLNLLTRRMLIPLDNFLDRFSMYRLATYFLLVLVGWSIAGSLLHKVGYSWYVILISAVVLVGVCRSVNTLAAKYLYIPKNSESDIIAGLILVLILSPAHTFTDFLILASAGAVAMMSKYILVIRRWHIFNPAALGAFFSAELFSHYASWWVGTGFITPVVAIGGFLVLRKIKRCLPAVVFAAVALAAIALEAYLNQSSPHIWHTLWLAIYSAPLLFMATVMLVEPHTSPRGAINYLSYAALVGFLYGYTKLGISPEESLLIGNVFTYIAEPNRRIPLNFVRKKQEADNTESFVFSGREGFAYQAGQYMEWTFRQNKSDARGNRRYFTIASSPTEREIMFTTRIADSKMSACKKTINDLKKGSVVFADSLTGEFVLPKSEKTKLAFLAGGIGVTPFRSMIKYIADFDQQRDIYLLYGASDKKEFAFADDFKAAEKNGVKTVYTTEKVNLQKIKETIPDYQERTFYISGPYAFVYAMKNNLIKLKIPLKQIKTDYFTGYN